MNESNTAHSAAIAVFTAVGFTDEIKSFRTIFVTSCILRTRLYVRTRTISRSLHHVNPTNILRGKKIH